MATNKGDKPADKSAEGAKTQQGRTSGSRRPQKNITIDLDAKDVTEKKGPEKEKNTAEEKPAPQKPKRAASSTVNRQKKSATGARKSTTKAREARSGPQVDKGASKNPRMNENKAAASENISPKTISEKRRSVFFGFIPALLGGAIALSGFWAIQESGLLPSPDEKGENLKELQILEQRIATLENIPAPAQVEAVSSQEFSQITKKLATLDEQTKRAISLAENPKVPDAFKKRLTALETRLGEVEANSNVRPKVGETVATSRQANAGLLERLAAIEARLSVFDAEVQSASSRSPQNSQNLDRLSGEMVSLREKVTALEVSLSDLLKDKTQTLSQADEAALIEELSAATKKIGTVEAVVAYHSAAIAKQASKANVLDNVARRVAFDHFQRIASSGAAFVEPLNVLKEAGFPEDQLKTLLPFAEKGLPTLEVLSASLDEKVTDAVIARQSSTNEGDADLTPLEKWARNARSVINIRRVGAYEPEKGSPLDELRKTFAAGDKAQFIKNLALLSEEEKAPFEMWLTDWEAFLAFSALRLPEADVEEKHPGETTQ